MNPGYECNHVEVDTCMIYHISEMAKFNPGQNIIVRCVNTDVMVIILYYSNKVNANIWMEICHSSCNTRRYINITDFGGNL